MYQLKLRNTVDVSVSGACADCRHAVLDEGIPDWQPDDVLVCMRYVCSVTGQPQACFQLRDYLGLCGPEGVGFEPIEAAPAAGEAA